jgi:Ca2+-binding RTX toxin-like protein
VQRVVFVFALGFILALGVAFSARNVGIGQEVNGLPVNCVEESPPADAPKEVRNLLVCRIDGTEHPDQIKGTDDNEIVDKIVGQGGGDTLRGLGGWNGLFGGTGQDTLVGGPKSDVIFAIDAIQGADEDTPDETIPPEEDEIECGGGKDTVYADKKDDVAKDCEKVKKKEPDKFHWFRRTQR